MRYALLAIPLAVGLMACGNDDGNINNTNNTAGCAVEANFTSIHDNLLSKPGCAQSGCHASNTVSGGLDLAAGKDEVYRQLTEDPVVFANATESKRVDTTPEASFLYVRLTTTDAALQRISMPPGLFIPDCQQMAVAEWITGGAPND